MTRTRARRPKSRQTDPGVHHITFDPFKRVLVTLVGVGGTGSLVLTHLVRLNQALLQLGSEGLHVRAFDPDAVSVSNVARQNYAPTDVGRNKAVTLVERCNLYAGTGWTAYPSVFTAQDHRLQASHVVITCVDSGSSRRDVHAALTTSPSQVHYWLDCGNDARTGQVILGQLPGSPTADNTVRLPHILDRDPTGMTGDDQSGPSCSALEALSRQHLFVNPHVALAAAQLLGELLLHGQTATAGTFLNLTDPVRAVALRGPTEPARPPTYGAPLGVLLAQP